MKRIVPGCLLVVLLMTLGLPGCRSISYYKTINSMALKPGAIAQADRFAVRPVNFNEVEKPSSYVTQAQFLEEMRAEIPEFTEELNHQAQGAAVSERVIMIDADGSLPSGVIVESHVVEVRLGWDFYKGGADYLVVDLIFKDAQSGDMLFESRVQTSSAWTNNLGHKMNTSCGRLGIATWNLVRPIISVIKHGRITPTAW
jgi:hypothetical protein